MPNGELDTLTLIETVSLENQSYFGTESSTFAERPLSALTIGALS